MTVPNDKQDNKRPNEIKTKSISPILLWCIPKSSEKHQFTATKVYVFAPEEAFAICPEHGQIVKVTINLEKQQGRQTSQNAIIDEDFFKKILCDRVSRTLYSHTLRVNYFLAHKSESPNLEYPSPLRLFRLFFSSNGAYQKEKDQISVILQKFKTKYYLPCEFQDIVSMPKNDLLNIYKRFAESAGGRRLYGENSSYAISDAFWDYQYPREPGVRFGKIPTLIVYWGNDEEDFDFVLPHTAKFTQHIPSGSILADRIAKRVSPNLDKTYSKEIGVYPFLLVLDEATTSTLKEVIDNFVKSQKELGKYEKPK